MSRNGWEHREHQAAEDQDEPKQKKNGQQMISTTYTHKTGIKQSDINGLSSEFTTLTSRSKSDSKTSLPQVYTVNFPLRQMIEPTLALKEEQYTNNLAAQLQNLFPLGSEPWARLLFNFLRYQVNHACLCNMICKKQAVKLWLLENKQHPTNSTLWLSLPAPGNHSLPSS